MNRNKKIGLAAIAFAAMVLAGFASCSKSNSASASGGAEAGGETQTARKTKSTVDKPEDFKYDLTKDGSGVVIAKVLTDGKALKIPDKIEDYPVVEFKEVGQDAVSFTSIVIPDSITKLGDAAFSPRFVDMDAVNNSSELAAALEAARKATADVGKQPLNSLAQSRARDERDRAEGYAAVVRWRLMDLNSTRGLAKLTKVTLSNSLTEIPAECFVDCAALKEITIPDSVTKIGRNAFKGCSALTEVKLPNHPIEYGSAAFADCPKLSLKMRKAIQDSGYTGEF